MKFPGRASGSLRRQLPQHSLTGQLLGRLQLWLDLLQL